MPESEDKHLERIFHPYAVEQMAAFIKKQPDPTQVSFVHYTSAKGALQILEKKRVLMRNVKCMSDYSEVLHGFTLLNDVLFGDNSKGLNALTAALDECAMGATAEAIQLFNNWWTDIRCNTYITSISEHYEHEDQHGRLSMWRAFGGTNVRVALVFKPSHALLDAGIFNLLVSPVAYLAKEQVERELHRVVDNVHQNHDFLKSVGRERVVRAIYAVLVAGVTCLKHEGFREECEWRLIYAPVRGPSPLITQERSTEVIDGIPQVIYKIPFDANAPGAPEGLKQLDLAQLFHYMIIGPALYPYSMLEAFGMVLQNAGGVGASETNRAVRHSYPNVAQCRESVSGKNSLSPI
jgi:hypothetical protein